MSLLLSKEWSSASGWKCERRGNKKGFRPFICLFVMKNARLVACRLFRFHMQSCNGFYL